MSRLFPLPLKQGSKGPAVNVLGLILVGSPYDPDEKIVLDGDYAPGGAISMAVKKLQVEQDLPETGDLDFDTFMALSDVCAYDLARLSTEMFQGETIAAP